jgi:type III secretion system low calcium response chaperone LcrH/SycD
MNKQNPPFPPVDGSHDDVELQTIIAGLQAGATIKDLKGVSDDTLEGMYALAYRFYRNGQLDEAETFFRFLCLYDFYNADYALGLAAVLHLKRDYDRAIGIYAVAQTLNLQDDRPMFHVGQCHLALGKLDLARDCFESVAERAVGSELGQRAQAYLLALQRQQGDQQQDDQQRDGAAEDLDINPFSVAGDLFDAAP